MKASQAFQEQPTEMEALWNSCSGPICSLEDKQKQLGLGDKVGLRFRSIFCNCFSVSVSLVCLSSLNCELTLCDLLHEDVMSTLFVCFDFSSGNHNLLLWKLQFGGC